MRYDPDKITYFAQTDARGQAVPFGIKAKDRQRHMYIIGKTGMGKSTLLENMAAQDIQNGEGVAFIDPHGSAAETLMEYIPEHRIDDVVYFAPFDMEHPIAFNVMEDVGADKRHLVVSGLMSTFKKIWVDAWSARMEYILTNALLALIEYPDTTLLSVNRLFSDKAYRDKVVDYIKDPAVKAFWTEEFASYTDRFAAEALPAIQNKIGQFTGNPLIRNIIGQPKSSFDIRELMDNRKILIMNLSKGLVGETNANLLGSMLTTRIYLAAMSRADLSVESMKQMPNFYFYVDEFQSFANSTFSNILSEARKYHLNLIIAHQYIQQMEEEVKDAVFGNVGTTVAFRVGPFDAEVLETVFTPKFLAADLVNLGFAQIYLTLMIDGIGSQPFSAVTLPPIQPPQVSYKRMVIAASRKNYANERAYIEQLVADLHTPTKQPNAGQAKGNKNGHQKPSEKFQENRHTAPKPTDTVREKPVSSPAKPDNTALKAVLSQVRTEPERVTPHTHNARPQTNSAHTKQSTPPATDTKRPENTSRNHQQVKPATNRPQVTDRPPASTKDSNVQLNELRSVLSKLSKQEKTKTQNEELKQPPSGKEKTRNKPPVEKGQRTDVKSNTVPDLKQTLQDVLRQHTQASARKDVHPPETAPPKRPATDQTPPEPVPATATDQQKETPPQAPPEQPAAKTSDPLDPKQLERMLKKGGSSQPPYA